MSKVADIIYRTIDYTICSLKLKRKHDLVRGKITLTFIKETKNFDNGFQKSKRKKRPSKKHGMKREKTEQLHTRTKSKLQYGAVTVVMHSNSMM